MPKRVQALLKNKSGVFPFIFARLNKSLHLFPIFLEKYEEMRGV